MLAACLALILFGAGSGSAAEVRLPDMGSPADAVLSKSDEAQIGRAIMQQIRRSGTLVEDPQVNEYINDIGHRVAAHANDGDHRFTFFVIDEPSVNAFALPGGYIGVHTGLIEATRSEDELAGVLAHEVAHVTQRHIARAIHASQRQSILTTALMLGAMIAGAAGAGGDVVQGAMAVAQGTSAQQQINFTRSNEYEADRVGIESLADAGFDPMGMATFFEVISRSTRPVESRVPEFLRTHPVGAARIAEARSRARSYPEPEREPSHNYGITRARLLVNGSDTPEEAVARFENQDYALQDDAARYGRATAYLRAGRNAEAARIFEELLTRDQQVIAYHIGLARAQLALEQIGAARNTYERALELFPRNLPLVIDYGEALLQLGEAVYAHEILLDLLNNVPPTPEQVRLIARAAIAAGDDAEAYYYMAEHSFMIGDLLRGVNFLQQALALPELQEIQRARFEARIDFIEGFMTPEQLQQMRRSQSGQAPIDVRGS
jgi:predicted Zn-dependent protease